MNVGVLIREYIYICRHTGTVQISLRHRAVVSKVMVSYLFVSSFASGTYTEQKNQNQNKKSRIPSIPYILVVSMFCCIIPTEPPMYYSSFHFLSHYPYKEPKASWRLA